MAIMYIEAGLAFNSENFIACLNTCITETANWHVKACHDAN